jgi:hypothetical protein
MSQDDLILEAMQHGIRLTPLDAMQPPYLCMRLASRINALRVKGEPVQDRWIKTPSGKRVKEYWIKSIPPVIPPNAPSLFEDRVSAYGGL